MHALRSDSKRSGAGWKIGFCCASSLAVAEARSRSASRAASYLARLVRRRRRQVGRSKSPSGSEHDEKCWLPSRANAMTTPTWLDEEPTVAASFREAVG